MVEEKKEEKLESECFAVTSRIFGSGPTDCEKEEKLELVDMLESGCYAVIISSFGNEPVDCSKALRSDSGLVLLLVKGKPEAIVIHATPDGDIVETYDYIEDAVLEIESGYGEEVVLELLKQALKPGYSVEKLKTVIREI